MTRSQLEIKAAAETCAKALVSRDYGTVADLTYGRLIELMGGREETITHLEDQLKELDDKGMTIVSITVGDPETVKSINNQQFSIVPTTAKLKYKDSNMVAESFMIAVSDDGGKRWKFVDGAISDDQELMKELFANVADKLQLPPKKDPVFTDK